MARLYGLRALKDSIDALGLLRRKYRKYRRMIFLGDILDSPAARRDYAAAYHDPEKASAEMGEYLWAVPAVPTPFVGEAPAPGRYGSAVINSQQLRHPVDLVLPRPAGVCRIFFTGSSTAFCSGAPSDATTITGYLQEMLTRRLTPVTGRGYEVVNASHPGWASSYERLWVEMRLVDLEPDVVIQFSGNNDAHWGARHFPVERMRSYYEQLFYLAASACSGLFGHGGLADVSPRATGLIAPERVAAILQRNVRQLLCLLPALQVHYLFILQPTIAETVKPLSEREARILAGDASVDYFRDCYREMRTVLEALLAAHLTRDGGGWFDYRDYSDLFDGCARDQEVFMDSYHFGDRGNELIAARLYEDLSRIV